MKKIMKDEYSPILWHIRRRLCPSSGRVSQPDSAPPWTPQMRAARPDHFVSYNRDKSYLFISLWKFFLPDFYLIHPSVWKDLVNFIPGTIKIEIREYIFFGLINFIKRYCIFYSVCQLSEILFYLVEVFNSLFQRNHVKQLCVTGGRAEMKRRDSKQIEHVACDCSCSFADSSPVESWIIFKFSSFQANFEECCKRKLKSRTRCKCCFSKPDDLVLKWSKHSVKSLSDKKVQLNHSFKKLSSSPSRHLDTFGADESGKRSWSHFESGQLPQAIILNYIIQIILILPGSF